MCTVALTAINYREMFFKKKLKDRTSNKMKMRLHISLRAKREEKMSVQMQVQVDMYFSLEAGDRILKKLLPTFVFQAAAI